MLNRLTHLWCAVFLCAGSVLLAAPKYLFVEGNIGAGKSTFLKVLKKHLDIIVVSEPCDEWQDINGYNLLDAFYKDSSRWACTFQLYAFMTRVKKQQQHALLGGPFQIMERSWFSDKYCFAFNAKHLGLLNQMEWNLYCSMWNWYVKQAIQPSGFIYLRVEPEICYERMQKRARNEESIVPLNYLQLLHACHEDWLISKKFDDEILLDIPVLVLDGALDFESDESVQEEFIRQILDFLRIHENIDFNKVI